jgi:hypothetical protein
VPDLILDVRIDLWPCDHPEGQLATDAEAGYLGQALQDGVDFRGVREPGGRLRDGLLPRAGGYHNQE